MLYDLNTLFMDMPALILSFFIMATIILIKSYAKIAQEKRQNIELTECIACKDEVLKEFKKMRHEYNNILQTITCFIEEENLEALNEYKSLLLQKTHLLNNNDLTQLVKLKDRRVLIMIYKLYVRAKETGLPFTLTIYNDIAEINPHKSELYHLLQDYLNHAYESAANGSVKINLKISANAMGLCFRFECPYNASIEIPTSKQNKFESCHKAGKNIFYNTSIQKDQQIQEILIPFDLNNTTSAHTSASISVR